MPLLLRLEDRSYTLAVWEMTESLDEIMQISALKTYIDEALKFSSLSRRQEWLTVRLLLHELLGEAKAIGYTLYGKPYFSDGSYQLSISHTKGYVAVMISAISSVSVDIEAYNNRIKRVVDRVFNKTEFFYPQDENSVFYELLIWSAKEVIVKTNTLKAINFRDDLCVQPFSLSSEGHFFLVESQTPRFVKFKINYIKTDDFVLTYNLM